MCRGVISRTLATLVASAIDLARGMGLNNDGTYYGYDAVVTQVHRMIWHQLCFLDIRVCEAQSPRARIRKDEFNTEFPLNVDDSELETSDLHQTGSQRWTVMTLSIARMECNEKIRKIYAARQRTRQGGDSDSAYIKKMLEMIYEFRQYMEEKYHPMTDVGIPIQNYTRLVIDLQCRRMHAIVLYQYHMSTRGRMPGWNAPSLQSTKPAADCNIIRAMDSNRDQVGAQDNGDRQRVRDLRYFPPLEMVRRSASAAQLCYAHASRGVCVPLERLCKARVGFAGLDIPSASLRSVHPQGSLGCGGNGSRVERVHQSTKVALSNSYG